MVSIDLNDLTPTGIQHYLQHAVAPRPVCLASTIDKNGDINLSPFSFFNLFSSNPPIVIFSPARRVRDNTTKHTLENVLEIPEVVINIVDYEMVQQVSLSSCEYPKEINEFQKAGFTMQPALTVKPPMVKESKIKLECRVNEVKPLGVNGGAGNLVICEVLQIHLAKEILDENRNIDQRKLNHVARLGGDWYCVVNESNLFEVEKPNRHTGIGIDRLPDYVRQHVALNGNRLAMLANVAEIPTIDPSFSNAILSNILGYHENNPGMINAELWQYAIYLLDNGNPRDAWQVLLRMIKFLSAGR